MGTNLNPFEPLVAAIADAVAARLGGSDSGRETKRLFTIQEAAEYLGRTPKAVENLIQRGAVPVTKIEGKRQLDRAALDKLISDRTYFEVA